MSWVGTTRGAEERGEESAPRGVAEAHARGAVAQPDTSGGQEGPQAPETAEQALPYQEPQAPGVFEESGVAQAYQEPDAPEEFEQVAPEEFEQEAPAASAGHDQPQEPAGHDQPQESAGHDEPQESAGQEDLREDPETTRTSGEPAQVWWAAVNRVHEVLLEENAGMQAVSAAFAAELKARWEYAKALHEHGYHVPEYLAERAPIAPLWPPPETPTLLGHLTRAA